MAGESSGSGYIQDPGAFGDFGGIQGLMSMLQSLFGGETTTDTSEESPEALVASQALMSLLMPDIGNNQFSPEAAERDAQGAVQSIIRQMTEAGLPTIAQQENASGGYGSTASMLLKNDLAARTAEAGANRVSQIKTQYAGARAGQVAQVISLINAMGNAQKVRLERKKVEGLARNKDAQKAAGAAAVMALLHKLLGGGKGSANPNKTSNSKNPQQQKQPQAPRKEGDKYEGEVDEEGRYLNRDSEGNLIDSEGNDPGYGGGQYAEEFDGEDGGPQGTVTVTERGFMDNPEGGFVDPWDLMGGDNGENGGGDFSDIFGESWGGQDSGGGSDNWWDTTDISEMDTLDPFDFSDWDLGNWDFGDINDWGDWSDYGGDYGDTFDFGTDG